MTVRERVLALKLKEKQDKNPEYVKSIGVQVNVLEKEKVKKESVKCSNY